MGQLGGMAGALAPSMGLKDPTEMYLGFLKSRTISDDLLGEFGLQGVYGVKTREEARSKLLERASFALGKDSMIRISVQDRDPARAAAMANAYVTALNKQNSHLAISESAQRRMFFEREVETEKNLLAAAESRLKETQQRTGFVEVSNQAQLVMSSIARLRAEITMKEVALQRLRMGATAENPQVEQQQVELSALRGELNKLEAGNTRQASGDPIVPVANVPEAGLEYIRAVREMKYHESLFEVLAKQYEAAKIDEAKEAPVIQVVDPAITPEKKSYPPRGVFTLLGAFFAAVAGGLFVYFSANSSSLPPVPSDPRTGMRDTPDIDP
jgi:uncharacterized protein involved in exopolysaccharide biosynthesis